MKASKTVWIDLGYIGHKADKLKALFEGYSETPNEYGMYLKFTNHTHLVVNQGVTVETNCFSKKQFLDTLHSKLLHNL